MAEGRREIEAREIDERVSERIESGELTAARRALSRGWRELVPSLPTRFAINLKRIDPDAVEQVLKRWKRNGNRPPLRVIDVDERLVVATARGKRLILGRLPSSEAKILRDLGAQAGPFTPRLIQIGHDDEGGIKSVTIEMVRPQARICSVCERPHFEDHPNCPDCQRKRRRRGPERFERVPLVMQELIEKLAAESAGEDDRADT